MKEETSKIARIRNLGAKIVLTVFGLILIGSQLYPFVMKGFMLTEKVEIWDSTEWILSGLGFFLAVGAAKYNTMLNIIMNKFNSMKNGKSGN